jgi:putative intracellular protease/amidase
VNMIKSTTALVMLIAALVAPLGAPAAQPGPKRDVLVVMSGAHLLNLQDGKVYATGYYLNELATPLRALINDGYRPIFASPNGDAPTMDASSNDKKFFGGDDAKRMETLRFIDGIQGLRHPLKLSAVAGHTDNYIGVFVPVHAPMVDLAKDKDLGKILVSFHDTDRPTALICHGPMALLSTLPHTQKFNEALNAGQTVSLPALTTGWPYAGYKVTVFSKAEEQQIEQPQLDGRAPYYNDEALSEAGAKVENGDSWKPHVTVDREVITGQQPFSDTAFADVFVAKLNDVKK